MRYKLPLHKHFMQFLPCSFNYTRTAFYVKEAPFMHMSDHSLKTRLSGHKTRKPWRRMNYRESIISFRSWLANFLSCQKCTPVCRSCLESQYIISASHCLIPAACSADFKKVLLVKG